MLIHSPTHAFLFKPGKNPFKSLWQSDAYTYTWVRDNVVGPRGNFVHGMWLDEEKMHYLVGHLALQVSENFQYYFKKVFGTIHDTMRPYEFRNYLLDGMRKDRGLKQQGGGVLTADEIDSALYTLLPLFSRSELRQRLEKIYAEIPALSVEVREKLMQVFDLVLPSFSQENVISAAKLQDIAKGVFCLTFEETSTETDFHAAVSSAAQKLGYAMPPPIIFADTNWVKDYFGFIYNPGSAKFELWRVDATGRLGMPMSYWDQWLDGSKKQPDWGIYTKPYEYAI